MNVWKTLILALMASAVLVGCQQEGKTIHADRDNEMHSGRHAWDNDDSMKSDSSKDDSSMAMDTNDSVKMVSGNPHRSMVVMLPAGKGNAAVKLTKTAPKQVIVGEPFEYTLVVHNQSGDALHDAVLTAKVPKNMDVSSTTPKAKLAAGLARWDIDKLPAGATRKFIVKGAATQTGRMEACSDMRFTLSQACLPIEAVEPALKVVLKAPDEVLICEPINYTATVTNTGSGSASDVSFDAKLPDGLSVANKDTVSRQLGTLQAGQSRRILFQADAAKTGSMNVSATAKGKNVSSSDAAKTAVRQPVLAVSVDMPKTRYINTPMTAKVSVKNNGDGEARRTVLTATIPDNVRFVSASDEGSPSGGRVNWNFGTLKPGASRTVSMKLKATAKGSAELYASSAATCTKASAKGSTNLKGIPAILLECVDTTDPVLIGQNTTYEISVTNQGSAVGTGIVITCTLPKEMDFVSASGPSKHKLQGKKIIFEPLKSLAPKKKTLYKVVTKGTAAGDLRFEVTLKSDQMKSPAGETESTHVYSDE